MSTWLESSMKSLQLDDSAATPEQRDFLQQESIILTTLENINTNLPQEIAGFDEPVEQSKPITIQVLRDELCSLLMLIGKEVTALALSLKPPLSMSAATGTLKKLVDLTNKLLFWKTMLNTKPEESALRRELETVVRTFTDTLRALLVLCSKTLRVLSGPATSGNLKTRKVARESILASTAQVWQITGIAISASELEAEKKEWAGVRGLLDDGLEEVSESLEDADEDEKKSIEQAKCILELACELLQHLSELKEDSISTSALSRISRLVKGLSPLADEMIGEIDDESDANSSKALINQLVDIGADLDEEWAKTWSERAKKLLTTTP